LSTTSTRGRRAPTGPPPSGRRTRRRRCLPCSWARWPRT
jgi:hypothetical protein